MQRPCTICTHPDQATINAALLAGDSVKPLCKRYGLSQSSIGRHKRNHLAKAALSAWSPKVRVSASVERIDGVATVTGLLLRAQQIEARNPTKPALQLQALDRVMRAVEWLTKQSAQSESVNSDADIARHPYVIRLHTITMQALVHFPEAKAAVSNALRAEVARLAAQQAQERAARSVDRGDSKEPDSEV